MFMSEVCTDDARQREEKRGGTEVKRGQMKKGGGEKERREKEKKRRKKGIAKKERVSDKKPRGLCFSRSIVGFCYFGETKM